MQPDSILTQDELDFILGMQHNPKLNVKDAKRSLVVNGGIQIQELLTRLAAHEQVTITAQLDNQQMTFPLHLVEDEFNAQHLELGAPSIYEQGPQIRPWRLSLPTPVTLLNEQGASTALCVHEISFKGVLIEYCRKGNPPKQFSAWFCPDEQTSIPMRGRFERLTERGMAAYRLKPGYKEDTERLRQYILQQHRRVHPAMHV